jgi:hypothetical protein
MVIPDGDIVDGFVLDFQPLDDTFRPCVGVDAVPQRGPGRPPKQAPPPEPPKRGRPQKARGGGP